MKNNVSASVSHEAKLWLRWVAVLPAALVAMALATLFSNIAFSFQAAWMGVSPDSLWNDFNTHIIGPAISAAAFVYCGTKTAPYHHRIVALVLGAILVIIVTVGVVSSFFIGGGAFWVLLTALTSLISGGYIVHAISQKGESYQLFEDEVLK